eukprot:scaffold100385_cov64-Phaeocystis_antarctica.AAC.6
MKLSDGTPAVRGRTSGCMGPRLCSRSVLDRSKVCDRARDGGREENRAELLAAREKRQGA